MTMSENVSMQEASEGSKLKKFLPWVLGAAAAIGIGGEIVNAWDFLEGNMLNNSDNETLNKLAADNEWFDPNRDPKFDTLVWNDDQGPEMVFDNNVNYVVSEDSNEFIMSFSDNGHIESATAVVDGNEVEAKVVYDAENSDYNITLDTDVLDSTTTDAQNVEYTVVDSAGNETTASYGFEIKASK